MTAATVQPAAVPAPQPGDTFYDSATGRYPAGATAVMRYVDGPNARPRPDYPHVHGITVEGGNGLTAVRAQSLDYELHLRTFSDPELAREWAEARIMQAERAIFYCNRASLYRLLVSLGHLIWTSQRTHFWIPTLDGHNWTPEQLAQDIALHWSVSIPASRIWANQNRGAEQTGGPWDASRLFGQW